MPVDESVRKKANRYFFGKVFFNVCLAILGAVFIFLFLNNMQHQAALLKQRKNNLQSLSDAVSILERNEKDAEDLSTIFHEGNQEMLTDLTELFNSGLFNGHAPLVYFAPNRLLPGGSCCQRQLRENAKENSFRQGIALPPPSEMEATGDS